MANNSQENARIKYSAVLSLKASEGEIQWNRYNAMLVVNTLIIGFIGFSYNEKYAYSFLIRGLLFFTPLLGILLCIMWHKMTDRGFMWTKFWINKAYEIENEIESNINPVQDGRRLQEITGEGVTKQFSLLIIIIFMLVYVILFLDNFIFM